MNATQRNFVINQAIEILFNKLKDMQKRLCEENKTCKVSAELTAKEIHAAIKSGELKLLPVSKIGTNTFSLSDMFDMDSLREAKRAKAQKAGYHLTGGSSVRLCNPIKPGQEICFSNYLMEVSEAAEVCNQRLQKLAAELMLGDNTAALQILEDLKNIKL